MKPGSSVASPRSTTRAPDGICALGPAAVIFPFATTTIPRVRSWSDFPSNMRAAFNTTGPDSAPETEWASSKTARLKIRMDVSGERPRDRRRLDRRHSQDCHSPPRFEAIGSEAFASPKCREEFQCDSLGPVPRMQDRAGDETDVAAVIRLDGRQRRIVEDAVGKRRHRQRIVLGVDQQGGTANLPEERAGR